MANYDSNYAIAQEISARIGTSPIPFDSVYSIALEIYNELGGEPAEFDSVYSILLGILPLVEGGVASKIIDDSVITTAKTWSSSKINSELSGKQDTISDLSDIRSGATLGATAVQPSALTDYATTSALTSGLSTKQDVLTAGQNISIDSANTISADGYIFDSTNGSLATIYRQDSNDGGALTANTVTGSYGSHAEGYGTTASGDYASHAEGYSTTASGEVSHAEGESTTASGNAAHAEGNRSIASGNFGSHAEGYRTTASGQMAHAEGYGSVASGDYGSHAEGYYTTASGQCSHAEGGYVRKTDGTFQYTVASGQNSHAEGAGTLASGSHGSHAEGELTVASGGAAHAEGGNGTTASGGFSHAEGEGTSATNSHAHSEGAWTSANGNAAHAEGRVSEANGEASHAEGYYTVTQNRGEHAEGNYNISHSGNTTSGSTLHSVGDGTGENVKNNAFEIMQNADMYIKGVGGYDGIHIKGQDSGITVQTVQEVISGINTSVAAKQDTLTAGTNITISGTTISATYEVATTADIEALFS